MIKKTQIYKIYINEVELILTSQKLVQGMVEDASKTLTGLYDGKLKTLYHYIDMCEKNSQYAKVIVYHEDFMKLYRHFNSIYTILEAAGGLIQNQYGEFLFIFRRGFWDLPKGKIEENESKKQAAIREVEEETGITHVEIISKLGKTYHTYKTKSGKRIIKKSFWYLMRTNKQELLPQTEEDIEKAEWLTLDDFHTRCHPVYRNILDVVEKYESDLLV